MRFRMMTTLLTSLSVLVLALFLLVKYLELTSVFFPGRVIDVTPDQAGMPYEDLYITTSDGIKINAWLMKAPLKGASTVIFAHGNAGTMSQRIMKAKFFYDLGLNVLLFDYRGYGRSLGRPSEKGIYLDAQAVYDYIQSRSDLDHHRVIGYGASLGGVVVIDLATQRTLAGLIVESSISSAKDMAKRVYPFVPSWMMSVRFDSLSKVRKIPVPKLFMHSPQDRTVPYEMGQELFKAAMEPKEFLPIQGGHNDGFWTGDSHIQESFKGFLRKNGLW